ncbi:putative signal transducing protein [Schlesneria sp.]|uniref:putative signal transducing protein n=1 Tax=Schlesneria sp. TaxID=2762018 RepID=UPI002F1C4EFB
MSTDSSESLVSVYSTPQAFDAALVKAMLADAGIAGSVEDANGPFPGISAVPCHVYVPAEYEAEARALIAEHEATHRERVESEFEEVEAEDDDLSDV